MFALKLILSVLAGIGHFMLWSWVLGHVLATAIPLWLNKLLELMTLFVIVVGPLAILFWVFAPPLKFDPNYDAAPISTIALAYLGVCIGWLVVYTPFALYRENWQRDPGILCSVDDCVMDLPRQLGQPLVRGKLRRLAMRLPGNDTLRIEVNQKVLEVPRLDRRLDGLSIAHFCDLHLEGKVELPYFQKAIQLVNQMQPDIIALTGDIVDRVDEIAWLPDLLAPLHARYGAYFILGNHDLKAGDLQQLREVVKSAGLIDLGSRWHCLEVNGVSVVLAGDELPWLPPGPRPHERPAVFNDDATLRILLAHTPDRFRWARQNGFDLVLSGHTHGGQLRFPGIGPLVSACRGGVKYSAGVFHESSTILHVSRGLSETFPFRFRCPAELTRLVLKSGGCDGNDSR